jgi:hypothetical protein
MSKHNLRKNKTTVSGLSDASTFTYNSTTGSTNPFEIFERASFSVPASLQRDQALADKPVSGVFTAAQHTTDEQTYQTALANSVSSTAATIAKSYMTTCLNAYLDSRNTTIWAAADGDTGWTGQIIPAVERIANGDNANFCGPSGKEYTFTGYVDPRNNVAQTDGSGCVGFICSNEDTGCIQAKYVFNSLSTCSNNNLVAGLGQQSS